MSKTTAGRSTPLRARWAAATQSSATRSMSASQRPELRYPLIADLPVLRFGICSGSGGRGRSGGLAQPAAARTTRSATRRLVCMRAPLVRFQLDPPKLPRYARPVEGWHGEEAARYPVQGGAASAHAVG